MDVNIAIIGVLHWSKGRALEDDDDTGNHSLGRSATKSRGILGNFTVPGDWSPWVISACGVAIVLGEFSRGVLNVAGAIQT